MKAHHHIAMRQLSSRSLLVPLGLFLAAVLLDINALTGIVSVASMQYLREAMIVLALILSLPIIYKQSWALDRNVLRGLKSLFYLILGTYLLLLLSSLESFAVATLRSGENALYESLLGYTVITAWTLFSSIFALVAFAMLRNLIFIKQKKNTALNFLLLMLGLVLYALLSFTHLGDIASRFSYRFNGETVGYFMLFVLINLMVINSFRISWLNYLNKKQKLVIFAGGLILVPLQWLLYLKFHTANPAALFSPVLGRFVDMGFLFLSIYLSVAFIVLVFYLPTAQIYDRKMRQLASMHDLSRTISAEFDQTKLVETIVKLAVQVTEADACWLMFADAGGGAWRIVASHNLSEEEQTAGMPERINRWIIENAEPRLNNHVAKSELNISMAVWKRDVQSLLTVPLNTSEKIIGCLFASKRLEYGFEQDDLDTLRAFGEQAVVAIENARLIESSLVKERLEQELRIAHDAQMKLLPKVMPDLPGFILEAVCLTANEVGGDYYDFFRIDANRLGIVIGDVSGKGPQAAFIMAELKGIMEALARHHDSPKQLLIAANETLYQTVDRNTFVSVIYGIMDIRKRCFTFCRAGQCPLLLAPALGETVHVLEPGGMGLGLDRGALFAKGLEEINLRLQKGDLMLMYTDGAIEARNARGEEFTEIRLVGLFQQHRNLSPPQLKERLINEIVRFAGSAKSHDDLTFLIVKAM